MSTDYFNDSIISVLAIKCFSLLVGVSFSEIILYTSNPDIITNNILGKTGMEIIKKGSQIVFVGGVTATGVELATSETTNGVMRQKLADSKAAFEVTDGKDSTQWSPQVKENFHDRQVTITKQSSTGGLTTGITNAISDHFKKDREVTNVL